MKNRITQTRRILQSVLALALLLPMFVSRVQAAQRPIQDFLKNQVTFLGWADPRPKTSADLAAIDYAGILSVLLEQHGFPPLGTTFSGTVTERPLSDGRAEVQVELHTYNALTWAAYSDFTTWPPTFLLGHDWPDVLNGDTLVLGDCTLKIRFINTAPGAELPDLDQLGSAPLPGMEQISLYFVGHADGIMADGSHGHLEITQTGLLGVSPPKPPLFDSFPVEHILLTRVGN